jgi:hypothetical protein
MPRKLLLVALVGAVFAGCQPRGASETYDVEIVALQRGQASAGRQVFLEKGCPFCHRVAWDGSLPEPTAHVTAPVLDERLFHARAGYLATSVVAPSYHVGKAYRDVVPGGLSPMADYCDAVTVRELADLVAYIQEGAQAQAPPERLLDRSVIPHHL